MKKFLENLIKASDELFYDFLAFSVLRLQTENQSKDERRVMCALDR